MTSLLLLLACGPDPLDHPNFQPPITMEVAVSIRSASGQIGAPFEIPVRMTGEGVAGRRMVVTSGGGEDGRGSWDEWKVAPPEGVRDPSPYWEDQRKGISRTRTDTSPGKAAEFSVRLDESVRFPGPGTYAVQLTTVRANDRLRTKPVKVTVSASGDLDARAAELLGALEGARGLKRTQVLVDLALIGAPSLIPRALEGLSDPAVPELWSLVLHAHPDRAQVRKALEHVFNGPESLVPFAALETYAALCYNDEYDWPVRLPKATDGDTRRFDLERRVRNLTMAGCRDAAATALVAVLPKKKHTAKGALLSTLVRTAVQAPERPSWTGPIATEAAKSIHLVDDRTQQTWLSSARYWSLLDQGATADSLTRVASGEASVIADLALLRLFEVDPAKAKAVALKRYTATALAISPEAELLISEQQPAPATLDALVAKLDGTSASRLRLAARHSGPRHAKKWSELYAGLDDNVPTPVLGAIAGGLLNTGHPDASAALDKFGPRHPRLLNEAANVARDKQPVVAKAVQGLDTPDGSATLGAGDVIAEYGEDRDLRAVVALVPRLDGYAEMGAMRAICTGRNWMVDSSVIKELTPTLENQYAATLSGDFDAADKDVIALQAFELLGQPAIRFSEREYIGEEAIKRKLRMLRPTRGVKFSFDRISAIENHARYAALAHDVGLKVIETTKKKK